MRSPSTKRVVARVERAIGLTWIATVLAVYVVSYVLHTARLGRLLQHAFGR